MNRPFAPSWLVALSCLAICVAGEASASTVNYLPDVNGPIAVAFGIDSATTGTSMAGQMVVSVNGGAPVLWTAPNSGSCLNSALCGLATAGLGNGSWTLSVSGNPGGVIGTGSDPQATAAFPWTLTNTSTNTAITSVVLGGVLANSCFGSDLGVAVGCLSGIVFDRDRASFNGPDSIGIGPAPADEGTPGGNFGITYKFSSESGGVFTANVMYSRIVSFLGGGGPGSCNGVVYAANGTGNGCGDSWGQLTFTFTGTPFQAGATNAVWSFFQDTDNAVAPSAAVPEPSTLRLMGVGLLALAALRRWRHR